MARFRKLALLSVVGVALLLAFFFGLAPAVVDGLINRKVEASIPRVSERAIALHQSAFVADLHADPLLWNRDLTARNTRGHLDFPRLREGNVALQVFSAVTQSPKGQNYQSNSGDTDTITQLAVVGLWPVSTWSSLEARAHYQAQKLTGFLEDTGGPLIRSADDLTAFTHSNGATGALLAIEGIHCLEGDLEAIDRLFAAGYRIFGLAHFFDNAFAGSAHGVKKHGLTPLGRQAVERFNALEAIIDLAHSSLKTFDEVLAATDRGVIVSHGGVRGTCQSPRNLSDGQLRALAKNGGLIGIGYWKGALCDVTPKAFAKAVSHAASVTGIEHVALGSDYDGATAVSFDASELAVVTQALLDEGFSETDIRAVLGGNVRRFLERWLPQ